MYLNRVLSDIKKASTRPKKVHAEHLFRLNEAVFNLPETDIMDKEVASRLFSAVENIRQAYTSENYHDVDANFFYDYLALLGTMQNQPFFSKKQTQHLISWISELVGDAGKDSRESTKISNMQAEIDRLKQRLSVFDEPSQGKGKSKTSGKDADSLPEALATGKGSGKKAGGSKGGKAPPPSTDYYYEDYNDEPPPPRPKKSKNKNKDNIEVEPELPAPKGKGKKGKGVDEKGSGKEGKGGSWSVDSKGYGKTAKDGKAAEKSNGKGKDKSLENDGSKGKSKGKSSGKTLEAPEEKESKGKGKGKGKMKKGKDFDENDEMQPPPPLRGEQKGRGKGKSGKANTWKATEY